MKTPKFILAVFAFSLSLVGYQAVADDLPRVFLIDAKVLAQQKSRISKDGAKNNEIVTAATRGAEKAMQEGPFSVMQKDRVPPSGNKHDYMSQAPYFWPDPKSANGLPYIRRDGEHNPEIDKISDHANMGKMARASRALALGYYLTGNQAYADRATLLLRTWFIDPETGMRPNLEFGQAIPGVNTGRSIGIIESRDLVDVVDAVGLLAGSKTWTSKDQNQIQDWFAAFLKWLRESEHGRTEAKALNNHGTYYDVQVATFALFTGDRNVAEKIVSESQTKRIASQVEPDGSQPLELARTRSLGYSLMNLRGLMDLAQLGNQLGLDLWHFQTKDGRSIRKAVDFLVPYANGDKKWDRPQITEFKSSDFTSALLRASAAYNDSKYFQIAMKTTGEEPSVDTLLLRSAAQH